MAAGSKDHSVSIATRTTRSAPLRIGFVDLIDAAPLIVAAVKGFFQDEGLSIVLERQLGWANIRDRITFGQLEAAHGLLGMPLFSQIHREWFVEPLVAVMNLGAGGDAITISKRLFDAGVRSATTLGTYMRRDPRHEVFSFGHVFGCSMHHYLLRDWLAAGKIHPDTDVRLRVFPPNQIAAHLERGSLDGFCVGEPWNTLAEQNGHGRIAALTTDILPNHPEKILVVTRRWMNAHESILTPMIRAILRACAFCDDESNNESLAEILSRPEFLNLPPDILLKSLSLDRAMLDRTSRGGVRKSDWCIRSFAASSTFPNKMHSAWLASQMMRWHHLPAHVNVRALADGCADSSAYRRAAESLGIDCPATDFPAMQTRTGIYDPVNGPTTEGVRHEA